MLCVEVADGTDCAARCRGLAMSPAEFRYDLHAAFIELQGAICKLSSLQAVSGSIPSHDRILGRFIRELEEIGRAHV